MEEFIIFTNTVGGRTAVKKSKVVSVFEDDMEGEVVVSSADDDFHTTESFDSVMSKLMK
jgi:hypothetical protein